MLISQKTQYALRALFELARTAGTDPVSSADIAREQAIPIRFLEVIMNQLKKGGFVSSRRGVKGGYLLLISPESLRVGDVIRFIQGPLDPVNCLAEEKKSECPLSGECVFKEMWAAARDAVSSVFDDTTFADLVEKERERRKNFVPDFSI